MTLFDISAATKLKHLVLRFSKQDVQWITMALQTANSKNLQQITLWFYVRNFSQVFPEMIHREWGDLDRLLVQFWTSHSICPKVGYDTRIGGEDVRDYTPTLLPELTREG